MSVYQQIGVILLAAGASRRLGQPKQLVAFQGQPLLQRMIEVVAPFQFGSKFLLLGAYAAPIKRAILAPGWELVENPQWEEGIASSIRLGVEKTLARQPTTEHLLFLLSDQPFVTPSLIQTLVETQLTGDQPITACRYQRGSGVPVVLARNFFPELQALQGDQGARRILKQHPDAIRMITFEKGDFDVDTPEDYERLVRTATPSNQQAMQITIKYFGVLAEETGTNEETLDLAQIDPTVAGVRNYCLAKYPLTDPASIQIAVNQQLHSEAALVDGDEVALLPPFSGG